MRHVGVALLFILTFSTAATAEPFFNFADLQGTLANPHFGSKLLMEAGLSHDAGLHLGSIKDKSFSAIGASIDFTSAPEGCRLEVQDVVGTPEPTTMFLLGTGLMGIGAAIRRARKNHGS